MPGTTRGTLVPLRCTSVVLMPPSASWPSDKAAPSTRHVASEEHVATHEKPQRRTHRQREVHDGNNVLALPRKATVVTGRHSKDDLASSGNTNATRHT